jgi:DNA-binding MarR family transcriptional regulator
MTDDNDSKWTFFSNYGHVYFLLAMNKDLIVREIAVKVGITERSVQGIIQELEGAGYISKEKVGRSNRYSVVADTTLRHHLEGNVKTKDLVSLIKKAKKGSGTKT